MWNKIEKSENEDIPNAYQFYFSTTGSRFSSLQKLNYNDQPGVLNPMC